MARGQYELLVAKIVMDSGFAEMFHSDLEAALNSIGIEPTKELLEALSGVDYEAIKRVASAIGGNDPRPLN